MQQVGFSGLFFSVFSILFSSTRARPILVKNIGKQMDIFSGKLYIVSKVS